MPYLSRLVIAGSLGDDECVATRHTGLPMRSDPWFGRFWTRLKAGVIQDVPASLEACEACREVACTQERWSTCARRLAAEAEQSCAGEHYAPSVTGRSDEMPGLGATDAADGALAQSTETGTGESSDRQKRVASSGD